MSSDMVDHPFHPISAVAHEARAPTHAPIRQAQRYRRFTVPLEFLHVLQEQFSCRLNAYFFQTSPPIGWERRER
jgi:hypothetical protein